MSQLSDKAQRIEVYCKAGLITERLPDGTVAYRIQDMRRGTVDAWFEATDFYDKEGHANQTHVCSIIDIRKAGWPTPYAITMATRSAQNTPPDLRESMAILVADTIGFRMVEIVIRKLTPKARHSAYITRSETAALEWLRERVELLKNS